jgi:hypothetical protein
MGAYGVALFIHVLGVATLFGAIALTQVGAERLRRAATPDQVGAWLGLTRTAAPMFPVAFILLIVTGLYMANDRWKISDPWVIVALCAVVIMGVVGGVGVGRGLGSVAAALGGGNGEASLAEARRRAGSRRLRVPLTLLPGMAVGVLWLMTNRPGWAVSTIVVAGVGVLGGAVGALTSGAAVYSSGTS